METQLADIATNEKKKLQGFKVLGIFPFYLKYITTGTHIRLCAIKEDIQKLMDGREPEVQDFYNSELQNKIMPLLNNYIIVALINSRSFEWLLKKILKYRLKKCGHRHILNLYLTICKLDEPAFFLSYWNSILQKDHTLLKAAKQS